MEACPKKTHVRRRVQPELLDESECSVREGLLVACFIPTYVSGLAFFEEEDGTWGIDFLFLRPSCIGARRDGPSDEPDARLPFLFFSPSCTFGRLTTYLLGWTFTYNRLLHVEKLPTQRWA